MVASCARSTKANLEFGVLSDEFNQHQMNHQDTYLYYLAYYGDYCVRGSERVYDINECLINAINQNDLSLVHYFLPNITTNLDRALIETIKTHNFEIMNYLISIMLTDNILSITSLNGALNSAAFIGNRLIIDYLLNIGKKLYDNQFLKLVDLNSALSYASLGEHLSIIEYLISLGAYAYNKAIYYAAYKGNTQIINYLINDKRGSIIDLNNLLDGASFGGHPEIVDLALAITLYPLDLNKALRTAALADNYDIVSYLISLGSTDLNGALDLAAFRGNKRLIDTLLALGATNLDNALLYAASGNNIEMIRSRVSTITIELYQLTKYENEEGQIEVVDYIIVQGSYILEHHPNVKLPNYRFIDGALAYAASAGDITMMEHLLSLGAINLNKTLFDATKTNQLNVIKYIIEKGSIVKNKLVDLIIPETEDLDMIFLEAVRKGYLDIITYLLTVYYPTKYVLERGINIAINNKDTLMSRYLENYSLSINI